MNEWNWVIIMKAQNVKAKFVYILREIYKKIFK